VACVAAADDGEKGLAQIFVSRPDLLVLDLMLHAWEEFLIVAAGTSMGGQGH
jgi:DNA-binding response OmpR family regulator